MDERERFEKLREDSLEQYTSRSTIMRFGDAEVIARADFRAGFHAGWQAHAESVGLSQTFEPTCLSSDGGSLSLSEVDAMKLGQPIPQERLDRLQELSDMSKKAESLSGDGARSVEELAESLHRWYLEATRELKPESFNPNAQKAYADLTEEQKFIDRFIARKLCAAQPASIEKAQDERELFAINYAEWAHGVKKNHDRRPTFEEQNSYTDGWNDAIRAALQRNGGRQ